MFLVVDAFVRFGAEKAPEGLQEAFLHPRRTNVRSLNNESAGNHTEVARDELFKPGFVYLGLQIWKLDQLVKNGFDRIEKANVQLARKPFQF